MVVLLSAETIAFDPGISECRVSGLVSRVKHTVEPEMVAHTCSSSSWRLRQEDRGFEAIQNELHSWTSSQERYLLGKELSGKEFAECR